MRSHFLVRTSDSNSWRLAMQITFTHSHISLHNRSPPNTPFPLDLCSDCSHRQKMLGHGPYSSFLRIACWSRTRFLTNLLWLSCDRNRPWISRSTLLFWEAVFSVGDTWTLIHESSKMISHSCITLGDDRRGSSCDCSRKLTSNGVPDHWRDWPYLIKWGQISGRDLRVNLLRPNELP